jgi:hypothetical protein
MTFGKARGLGLKIGSSHPINNSIEKAKKNASF